MQFNDTTLKDGLIQDCEMKLFGDEGYGQISDDADRLLQFTNRLNRAQDRFTLLAMTASGKWQWDDENHKNAAGNDTYNIGVCSLEAGKRDYQFALEALIIDKVFIKISADGVYTEIYPVDPDSERNTASLTNGLNVQGVPFRYDKRANAIFLDPIPSLNISAGLKVYFRRPAVDFVSTDTDRTPGFPTIFHPYLSLHASQGYAADHTMPVAGGRLRNGAYTGMLLQVINMENDIEAFFGRRSSDERPKVKPRITKFK